MSNPRGSLTVGVDIGTTAVKALAVDENGEVVARSRVAHRILASEADQLRHDARRAWRAGPAKAYAELSAELAAAGNGEIAGVAVTSMVPSLTAVNRRGVPTLPGLLYGDFEGRPPAEPVTAGDDVALAGCPMRKGSCAGPTRWPPTPGATGPVRRLRPTPCPAYRPSTPASRPPWVTSTPAGNGTARSSTPSASLRRSCPTVVPMATAGGTLPGTETVFTGGSIDAMCDQIVGGATEPGDVHVIFGATLIAWVVTDEWLQVPGLISYPHTTPERFLIGGPSNAGALFVDWARTLLRDAPPPRARP